MPANNEDIADGFLKILDFIRGCVEKYPIHATKIVTAVCVIFIIGLYFVLSWFWVIVSFFVSWSASVSLFIIILLSAMMYVYYKNSGNEGFFWEFVSGGTSTVVKNKTNKAREYMTKITDKLRGIIHRD